MPPRIREVTKLLQEHGWTFERWGKGDHRVFKKVGETNIIIAGSDNHEMRSGQWKDIRKRLGLRE